MKIRNNPTEKENLNINRNIKSILKQNKELINKFTTICPTLPYLYGVIKTHKPNNPARPIVSSVGSCTYKLSKWLVKELSPVLGTISGFSVINNEDFINRLKGFNFNYDFKLVSFDVTSFSQKSPLTTYLLSTTPSITSPYLFLRLTL